MKSILKYNKKALLVVIMTIVTISVIYFAIYMKDSYRVKAVFK